jgi:ABC-type phosphate transport system substrate-binding protein
MKSTKSLFFVALFLLLASLHLRAEEVKIIANPNIQAGSVSAEELKNIFLQINDSLSGTHVQPVIAKSGAAHEAFLKHYLGKNDTALQMYYRSLVFTGKGMMPKVAASDAEIVAYVSKTKGAIGYINAGADAAGVKVLQVK